VIEKYKKKLFVELKDPTKFAVEALNKTLEGWDNVTVISFYANALKDVTYPSKGLLFVLRPLNLKNLLNGLDVEWIAPRRDMLDEELVEEAHSSGLKVLSWLHNRPKEVKQAKELNVDAIATDRPDLVVKWLRK